MENLFEIQVALSFLVGGAYIAGTIWLAERFGTRWGGTLMGLPSTALVSLLFIGFSQGKTAVFHATSIMPLVLAAVGIFLIVFQKLQDKGMVMALGAAILAWAVLSLAVAIHALENIALNTGIGFLVLAAGYAYFRKIPDGKTAKHAFKPEEFLARAAFCGLVVASAVFLSKTSGPLWSGILATFPAAMTSGILLLWKKQGAAFTESFLKAMQKALFALLAFIVVAHFSVLTLGVIGGLALGYAASLATALILSKA